MHQSAHPTRAKITLEHYGSRSRAVGFYPIEKSGCCQKAGPPISVRCNPVFSHNRLMDNLKTASRKPRFAKISSPQTPTTDARSYSIALELRKALRFIVFSIFRKLSAL
jgi:hypothetical protein